jgi:hypothetical protein
VVGPAPYPSAASSPLGMEGLAQLAPAEEQERQLSDVLDPVGQADSWVHAVLPHRDARRGEVRVGERADRHRDVLRVDPVVDGRAAARAEEERALLALIGDPHVLGRVALNPYLLAGPSVPASRTHSLCAAGRRGSGRSRP